MTLPTKTTGRMSPICSVIDAAASVCTDTYTAVKRAARFLMHWFNLRSLSSAVWVDQYENHPAPFRTKAD